MTESTAGARAGRGVTSRLLSGGGRWAALAVLACGVVLSIAAWFIARTDVERDARGEFHSATVALAAGAQARIQSYSDLLYGLQGLFQAEPALSRDAFDNYVYSLNLPLNFPGIRSVAYVRRVPATEKAKFEKQLRSDPELIRRGVRGVLIKPPAERSEYLVIEYIEPLHESKAALGFDLASDPHRMEVVERARDTGMPTLSGRVALALDSSGSEPAAVVMRLALYRKNAFTPDVERRREAFVGLANITFQVLEWAQQQLSVEGYQNFSLRIYDAGYVGADPKPAPQELYSNISLASTRAGKVFEESRFVDVGQRRWELKFSAPQEHFLRAKDRVLPWAALAAVLALSLLLGGLIRSLAGSGERARALAEDMTADLRQSRARLAEEQRRTQELIEVLPNPVYFKGTDGRYLGVNRAWETYFGRTRRDFLGKTVHELYPDDLETAQRLHADDQAVWEHPGAHSYETAITAADGYPRSAIYYKATFAGADGAVAGLIGTIVDITERKKAEQRLTLEHAVTRMLSEADRSGGIMGKLIQVIGEAFGCDCGSYWSADEERQALTCVDTWSVASAETAAFAASNRRMVQLVNQPGGLIMRAWNSGEPVSIIDMNREQEFKRAPLAAKAGLLGAFAFPIRAGNINLGVMEFFSRASRPRDEEMLPSTRAIGAQIGLFISRGQAEERFRHLAHYDALTGLANRTMFSEYLKHAIIRAQRNVKSLSVLFIDLDRFKNINDTLGHDAGDAVLKQVADRLRACLRAGDTVGRLGGDEFVVLLEEMPEPMHSATAAKKIIDTVAQGFVIESHDFNLTASVGISTYPEDGEDMQVLLKNADIAMYRAKELGKNNYQFYSAKMNVHSVERLALETGLRRALERSEFVLHYQPKIDIRSGCITGMEALIRLQHPSTGLVPPMQFIPLAEETGLIVPIGEWVLRTACAQNKTWRDRGLPPLRVAVNLSARQFAHEHLLRDVERVLKETGLEPTALELEITESMVMQDPKRAVTLMRALKAMGIYISIDDFGTGYSSLSYLKRFPIDSIKIDRSFIMDLPLDKDDTAIALAIIAMTHGLKLVAVAEGVETGEQLTFLRENGCDEMQGFHFSKPVPEEEFSALVLNYAARGSLVPGVSR